MDALQRQDGANSVQTASLKQAKMMIFHGILSFAIEQQVASCIHKPRISLGNGQPSRHLPLVGPNTIVLNLFRLDRAEFGVLSK
ncbi:hypothetical protein E4U10_002041 [Claviceps purpurea]|nr:hypothetical protein E4U10_002041 [Claviceps purpurea]